MNEGRGLTVELLITVPAMLFGLSFAAACGTALDHLGVMTWWIPVLLMALGAPLTLWRPYEKLLVLVTPQLRHAPRSVQERLSRLIDPLVDRTGLTPRRWIYVIERSSGLNASTSGRHVVSLTPQALQLDDVMLEAILAHELGHQANRDTIAKALRWWFLLPVRPVADMARYAALLLLTAGLFSGVLPDTVLTLTVVVYALLLPLVMLGPLHAWVERGNELAADRFAARAGYREELVVLFSTLEETGRRGWFRRLMDSHPSSRRRVAELLERL